MKFKQLIQSAMMMLALSTGTVQASLIGNTIDSNGFLLGPASSTIGAGTEFIFQRIISFDFDANTLTLFATEEVEWAGFGAYTFSGFDTVLTGFELTANDGFSGDVLSGYSFTASSISLNWGMGSAVTSAELVFAISTIDDIDGTIPEPSGLALLLIGALGLSRKARKMQ